MMAQEQMEVKILKLETENDEIKRTISEMQQEIKKTCSLLEQLADLMTSGKQAITMAKILLSESDMKALENGEIVSAMIYGYLIGIQKDTRKPEKVKEEEEQSYVMQFLCYFPSYSGTKRKR